jgi:hypothetical protein
MQVASLEETHIFSPRALNTLRLGYSRAAFNLESSPLASFSPALSFVNGASPGGIVINGGVTTTGSNGTITSAGPNNAAGVWNRRNLFTASDTVQITRGTHQISAGVWLQRLRDNEDTASRQLGVASFSNLTTFLQGTVTTFQVVPNPNELGWRSLYGAWYFEDAIRLAPHLTLQAGIRHEFTSGWNEVSGRAANYVTDSSGVLVTAPHIGGSAFTKNNAKLLFSPRISLAWDPFGNGKTAVRAGFGTYYSLIDALSYLLNSLPPANGSVSYAGAPLSSLLPVVPGVQPAPSCSAAASRPARSTRRRASNPMPRLPRWKSGISPSSANLPPARWFAWPTSGRTRFMACSASIPILFRLKSVPTRVAANRAASPRRYEARSRKARSTSRWARGRIRTCPPASSGIRRATAVTTR